MNTIDPASLSSRPDDAAAALARNDDRSSIDAERDVLGVDHALVGEVLARHWHFSPAIQSPAAGHPAPLSDSNGSLAGLVHLADIFSHALDLAGDASERVPAPCASTWRRYGLEPEHCEAVFAGTEFKFAGACASLAP